MPDREKVIKGLESQLDDLQKYADADEVITLTQHQVKDILDLLKEQEAVEPKHNSLSPTDWFCGKCGMCVSRFHDYCPYCGRTVKWDD